jgi:hypothetical protein
MTKNVPTLIPLPPTSQLVSYHRLKDRRESCPSGLRLIHNPPHLLLLFLRQDDITRSPVLLETLGLCRSRDGNQTLRCDPGKRNLRNGAVFPYRQLLDLVYNSLVFVEVLPLELGYCAAD